MIDGDIFRIIVPLDDEYSFEVGINKTQISNDRQAVAINVSYFFENKLSTLHLCLKNAGSECVDCYIVNLKGGDYYGFFETNDGSD